jgi:hypothetical protein
LTAPSGVNLFCWLLTIEHDGWGRARTAASGIAVSLEQRPCCRRPCRDN